MRQKNVQQPGLGGASISDGEISRLVPLLLKWFMANARDLRWRGTLDPYLVWVSEIMLQQTQVKTVIPYFDRWMRELPTIQSLASASSEKIHKLWEGLGYYTRVRNMQRAAQIVMEKHRGEFPTRFDDVLALPGIGRYTAGAICSIAFNQPTPILDGNVIRVLTRVFGIRENPAEKKTKARLWSLADSLVRGAESSRRTDLSGNGRLKFTGSCSALNQSLMELGALVCTPKQPRCEACPLHRVCVARRDSLVELLPNLAKRIGSTVRRFAACVVGRGGAVLVRRRPEGVVNAHLWEFPNVELTVKASHARTHRELEAELGCAIQALVPLVTVRHTITRYRMTLEAFRVELNGTVPHDDSGQWVAAEELDNLPFTSAHRRVLAASRQANKIPA